MKRLCSIVAMCILVAAGGVSWYVTSVRGQVRAWKQEHAVESAIGKSADEVIARLGKPYAITKAKDGSPLFIAYKGPQGIYLGISFENGVAVKGGYWGQ